MNSNLPVKADAVETALVTGDLAKLTAEQRVALYMSTCESLGVNHLTKPFDYLQLNGKLVLYANRSCSDQLRKNNVVSVQKIERRLEQGICFVDCYVTDKTGRTDVATGAVAVQGLSGEKLANAVMKAETKAKRRATLSICGLGWLDETEVGSIEGAKPVKAELVESKSAEVPPAIAKAFPGSTSETKHAYFYSTDSVPAEKMEATNRWFEQAGCEWNDELRVWRCDRELKTAAKLLISEHDALQRAALDVSDDLPESMGGAAQVVGDAEAQQKLEEMKKKVA